MMQVKKASKFLLFLAGIFVIFWIFFLLTGGTATVTNPPPPSIQQTATTTSSYSGQSQTQPSTTTPVVIQQTSNTGLQFGIAAGGGLEDAPPADLLAELTAIKKLGVEWVRFDIDWSVIQQNGPNSYNWTPFDRVVADLNAVGLKGLGIITYTPAWAAPANCPSGDNKCAPADPAQFAAFAQAVVKRYSSQGMHTWEIWNEPNITDFWHPTPNIAAYTQLLKDSYIAIKQQDPSALVLSGGLSRATTGGGDISPTDFLSGLYADGAKGYFDAVAFHPYTFPQPPSDFQTWNAWSQIAGTNPSIRSIMVANGDGNKKIWLTEYGAPTGGVGIAATNDNYASNPSADHVTEAFQAQMISQAVDSAEAMPWVGALFIYTYSDINGSTSYNENFFGLVHYDGSSKPAYTALQQAISQSSL